MPMRAWPFALLLATLATAQTPASESAALRAIKESSARGAAALAALDARPEPPPNPARAELERVCAELEAVADALPASLAVQNAAAGALLELRRYPRAARLARRALSLSPGDRSALSVLAQSRDRDEGGQVEAKPAPPVASPVPESPSPPRAVFTPKAGRSAPAAVPAPGAASYDPGPALKLLERSPSAADIVEFMRSNPVPFVSAELPPGTQAAYIPARNEYVIPADFSSRPLLEQAVILAHEGQHAKQTLKDAAAVCLETEYDAGARHRMIFAELREAGVAPLPKEHFLEEERRLLEVSIREGDPKTAYESIRWQYKGSYDARRDAELERAPEALRPAILMIRRAVGPYGQRNAYSYDDFLRNPVYWLFAERSGLARSKALHEKERTHFTQWLKKRSI